MPGRKRSPSPDATALRARLREVAAAAKCCAATTGLRAKGRAGLDALFIVDLTELNSSASAVTVLPVVGAAAKPRPARVLIIEDDPDIARLYALKLSMDSFSVTIAGDGRTGLEAAAHTIPDVILLDMRLPALTGLEVLAALGSRERAQAPPVLILSNIDDPVLRQEALTLGACAYLLKSRTTPREVSDRVKQLVG